MEVLAELRGAGASIIDCVKVVREVGEMSLGEAKVLVDESSTWADRREANQRIRADIVAVLTEADEEQQAEQNRPERHE
jgi:ribosomal protein L7/L12